MENPATKSVYSLVVDICHSTQRGMAFTTAERDSFNMALSQVLDPFIEKLDLSDSVIKFTGDGWIISISGGGKIINLVGLALLLSTQFNSEMERLSKITFEPKLDLKIGLAYGMDIKVQFNKRDDFVGDSIRKATRIESICDANEILIDSTIRSSIFRDFENRREDKDERIRRLQIKKFETDIDSVFSVGKPIMGRTQIKDYPAKLLLFDALGMQAPQKGIIDMLKGEASNQSLSPEDKTSIDLASINLSTVVGKTDDSKIIDKKLKQAGYQRPLSLWNRKINLSRDYTDARAVFEEIRSAGIQPDVITFSILTNKAVDYTEAKSVLNEMIDGGVPPDVVTFSTLMAKAADYKEAESVLKKMDDANIPPNVVTFNTLMDKAADYKEAESVLKKMDDANVKPNVATYCTLFSKNIGNCKIEDIHKDYLRLKNRPSSALEPLIKRLFGQGKHQEAYYLILNHPHLPAAMKIVSENFSQAVSMYERFKTKDFYEANIDYALGIACFDIGKRDKAIKHLKKALTHKPAEQRIKHIHGLLEQAGE